MIHLKNIPPGKAPGKTWIRACAPTTLLIEYAVDTVDQEPHDEAAQIILEALARDPTIPVLSYCYCGTTGECLQTVTTMVDKGEAISLSSMGFMPIDHEPINYTGSDEYEQGFRAEWSTLGDQRFLIKVNAGFPSSYEKSIARTITQFNQRYQTNLALLCLTSTPSPNATPPADRLTTIDLAITRSDAARHIHRIERLEDALRLLYDNHVRCAVHVYPDPAEHHPSAPITEYLHACFRHAVQEFKLVSPQPPRFELPSFNDSPPPA